MTNCKTIERNKLDVPKLKTYKFPFFLFELNGKCYITDVRFNTEGKLPGKVVHEDDVLVLALRKLDELYMKYLEEKERKKKRSAVGIFCCVLMPTRLCSVIFPLFPVSSSRFPWGRLREVSPCGDRNLTAGYPSLHRPHGRQRYEN